MRFVFLLKQNSGNQKAAEHKEQAHPRLSQETQFLQSQTPRGVKGGDLEAMKNQNH